MEAESLSREESIQLYKPMVEPLLRYIPWLEGAVGKKAGSIYHNDGIGTNSLAFPVYDSTLMGFVKEMSKTKFMDRNYAYIYSHNRMYSVKDELQHIEAAKLTDMKVLGGIFSKYILGGMTKGNLWTQGVEEGIFLELILKMKSLMEFTER